MDTNSDNDHHLTSSQHKMEKKFKLATAVKNFRIYLYTAIPNSYYSLRTISFIVVVYDKMQEILLIGNKNPDHESNSIYNKGIGLGSRPGQNLS
jgi:hypothetical protein